VLDRALFSKTVPIAAARIANLKNISRYKTKLEQSKELIRLEKITNVRADPDPSWASKGAKCLLLTADVKPEGRRSKLCRCACGSS
jgi:tRNA (guanine37-N1)-methyltransferase